MHGLVTKPAFSKVSRVRHVAPKRKAPYLAVNKHVVPLFADTKNMLADPMTKVVDQITLSQFLEITCNLKNNFILKR